MKRMKIATAGLMLAGILMTACEQATALPRVPTQESTATLAVISTNPPGNDPGLGKDPQNATYMIEGMPVTLVNGMAEEEAAPGSASKKVTNYFGNAVEIDLNSDGLADSAFLLTQEGGGSGTFFYVAAAINRQGSYQGTNAIFLGDRIAPQSTNVDPENLVQFIVNYADRKPDEPMSTQPSLGVSRTFKLENDSLVEVVGTPTRIP